MNKPKECYICGCTEDNPCITNEGPCAWAFETRAGFVCTACIVELPPDPARERYPNDNLLIEKVCINCSHLIKDTIGGKESYTCEKGKFDPDLQISTGGYHWFAWSGIRRRNKTVVKARRSCQEWALHPRWQPKEK